MIRWMTALVSVVALVGSVAACGSEDESKPGSDAVPGFKLQQASVTVQMKGPEASQATTAKAALKLNAAGTEGGAEVAVPVGSASVQYRVTLKEKP